MIVLISQNVIYIYYNQDRKQEIFNYKINNTMNVLIIIFTALKIKLAKFNQNNKINFLNQKEIGLIDKTRKIVIIDKIILTQITIMVQKMKS